MENIILKGGSVHYSVSSRESYRVEKGQVLVYLIPKADGEDGRRMFLCEYPEGSRIPGFAHDSDLLGKWCVALAAMDTAEIVLEEEEADDQLRAEFAKRVGLKYETAEEFEPALIERYERNSIKERAYIYSVRRDQERQKEQTLELIGSVFETDKDRRAGIARERSGKVLYDASAYICHKKHIPLAPYERIQECCGRNPSIQDIARVSHFPVREIVLEPGWHKKDNGPVLAFRKDNGQPVACLPKGPNRYFVYDPKKEIRVPVTDKIAGELKTNACMFYRPFPEKAMTAKDLFRFGMKDVYVSDLIRVFVLALIGTLIGLLIPYLNEQAYDRFIPMGNASGLAQIGVVMLAFMMGNIAFTIVQNLAQFRSMNAMEYAAQSAAFDRLFNLPESFFRQYDAASLGQKVMGISTIYNVIASTLISALLSAVFSLMYLGRMFRYSGKMAAWALVIIAVLAALILVIGFRQIKYEKEKREVDIEAGSRTFQFLNGIAKIRNSWAEERALHRYFQKSVESVEINTKKERMTITVTTIAGAATILTSIIFYFLMIRRNIGLSIGEFAGFMAAFGSFSGAILGIVQNFLVVNQVKPLYDDVKPILETLPELSEDAKLPGKIEGEIELNNITFSYDPEREPVLRNLNLHVKPGEYLGVVGSSGCGKSTLLKLLLGFEKPQLGKVFYDKRDIDDLDKRELRKKFGVVLQDGGLISGSIYDNITITSPGTKISQVEKTIRKVGLEEDIRRMPMGLHTMVSEGMGTVSGGQRQRILIARAIVGNPKVIFLDEATSALDNVTQNQVVETLEEMDATKIVIAHRLSTVKNCDRIIVMDKGQIVEEGTYDQLMEQKGMFYELAIRQIS